MLRRLVRARPFTCFFALALVIASLVVVWRYFYGLAWEARTGAPFDYLKVLLDGLAEFHNGRAYPNIIGIAWVAITREPIYFGVFLFAGSPTISAIVICAIGWGWAGVKRLFSRLKFWGSNAYRRDALVAYATIGGFFLVYSFVNLYLIYFYQGVEEALMRVNVWGLPLLLFPLTFLIGGFIDEGATSEELGWRGFALPTLLAKMKSPLVVSLFLGALWWFWHFPREVPTLMTGVDWGAFLFGQSMFLVLVMGMSVVMTFFFYRTGGSAIPALLLHGWGNFVSKDVGIYLIIGFDERVFLWVAAALLIIAFHGPSLGKKRYEEIARASGEGPESHFLPGPGKRKEVATKGHLSISP